MNKKMLAAALLAALAAPVLAGDFDLNRLDLKQVVGELKAALTPAIAVDAGDKSYSTGSCIWERAEYPVPYRRKVIVYILVNDVDWTNGKIASGGVGPVTIKIRWHVGHGFREKVIYTAGGAAPNGTELGPMLEIAPGAGVFRTAVTLDASMDIQIGYQLVAEYLDPTPAGGGAPELSTSVATLLDPDNIPPYPDDGDRR